MKPILRASAIVVVTVIAAMSGCSRPTEISVKLSGDQEVPPVQTLASGTGTFTLKDDMSLSGGVKTEGIQGTAAHVHQGAPGTNGGVEVPLIKHGENEWVVPPDTKLTTVQMNALDAGDLYVNVHSDAYPGGEIRGQLKK